MLRKRLGVLGLAFALATTTVFSSTVGMGQVYAQEEVVVRQVKTVDLDSFLSLLNPENLIQLTLKDEKEIAEIQAVVDEQIAGKVKTEEKARAIYNWVATNVTHRTTVSSEEEISSDPYGVFTSGLAVCGGFSNLLREMMHMAEIPCVAVAGNYGTIGAHQWNAICIDGRWILADATDKNKGLFDNEGMLQTHIPQSVIDVTIQNEDLELGFYNGLAVVGAAGNKVKIPNEYEGYPITSVSAHVFSLLNNVEEIELNANISEVEISTLKSSAKIKSISVLEGNSKYASHQGALFNADYSQLLVYPKASQQVDFTIPKQTKNIDVKEAFEAPKLQNIYVDPDNADYSSYEGALYNKDQTKLLYVPVGKTTVKIPDTAEVDDLAFANAEYDKLTIIAKSDSPAADYARRLNLNLQEPEENNQGNNPEQSDTTEKKMDVRTFLRLNEAASLVKVTVTGAEKDEMQKKVDELTSGVDKTYDKAKAIYDWIAENISYISDQSITISAEPYDVFKNRQGVCGGFSNLLREMMHLAGIPAVAIAGYYNTGSPHQWNAVYVDEQWVYADATARNFFNVPSLDTTHQGLEIVDVTIDLEGMKLGYYGGLAVVSATGNNVIIPDKYQEYPITAISYRLFGEEYKVEEIDINTNITELNENTISTMKSSPSLREINILTGNNSYASRDGILFTSDYSTLLVYPVGAVLTSFTLPAQTTGVDIKEDFGNSRLENIYVEEENRSYSSYDGAVYNKDKTRLLCVPAGKTEVEILETAQIDDYAFANVQRDKLTIIAKSDSPAANYARMYGMKLQEPGSTTEPEDDNQTKEMNARTFLTLCNPEDLMTVTLSEKEREEIVQVVNPLIKELEKEEDKAKAIYQWITENIDYVTTNEPISSNAYDVFTSKKAVCGGFSNLLNEMMHLAGIPSVAITGILTNVGAHQWNAVYLDKKWIYADSVAAGYFDEPSMETSHQPLEVLEVSLEAGDLQFGYYHGLAVVGSKSKKVEIPEKYQDFPVTAVSYRLLGQDYQVEEIILSANIDTVDESTLKSSSFMKEISVAEGNKVYASRDGALFNADFSKLLVYPAASERTVFTIPANTNTINMKEDFASPKLQTINVEKGNQTYSSYDGALYNRGETQLLCVPAGKTSIRVLDTAEISDQAFANTDREKITIIAASASPAAEFARKNNYQLQVTDEVNVIFKDENHNKIIEMAVVIGQTVTPPEVTEREGYIFLGWFTKEGDRAFDFNTVISEPLELIQRWEKESAEEGGNETPGGNVSGNETPDDNEDGDDYEEAIEGIWVSEVENQIYSGKKLTPHIHVYDGEKLLTEKADYTISYKNNTNSSVYSQSELEQWMEHSLVGSSEEKKAADKKLNALPQIIIKMKGNYSGTEKIYFVIIPKSISDNDITRQDLYVNYKAKKEQKPTPVISWNGKKLSKKDFKVVTYENKKINFIGKENEAVTIPLTIEGMGNYTGTATIDLTIGKAKTDFDMNKTKVFIQGSAKAKISWENWKKMEYRFSEEDIVVKNGNTELSKDSYQIAGYENNDRVGTGILILQGKKESGYHGRKYVTFQIKGTTMTEAEVYSETGHDYKTTGYVYTGEQISLLEQKGIYVGLKNNKGHRLTLGKEYFAEYSNCINKGTATLELSGNPKEGYSGTKKITYKITQEEMANLSLKFAAEEIPAKIMKGGAKPVVQLTLGEKQLTDGRDYTLTYKKNKDVTDGEKTAEVLIKGKGNFKGSITKKFAIEKKGIEEGATVVAKDLVSKNGSWKQSFKVYDADGKELKANKDYVKDAKYEKAVTGNDGSVSYEEVTSVQPGDVIRITVTGMGSYAGSGVAASVVTGTYRILQENYDISKAKFVIAPQEYNGDKVELTLDQKVFTKAEIKKGKLVIPLFDQEGKACFEIVPGSYQKNDRKGTAKVTLQGVGSFGGQKTVTFKITSRATKGIWKGLQNILDFMG